MERVGGYQLVTSPKGGAQTEILFHGVPLSEFFLTENEIVQNIDTKDWLLHKILFFGSAIATIQDLAHLVPNPIANTLFGGIVLLIREFSKNETQQQILNHPLMSQLRSRIIDNCALAEYYLEAYYATQVISKQIVLEDFPYFENYQLLMSFEAKCLQAYIGITKFRELRHVAFIGSGPLPLSSIEFLEHLPREAKVVNFDLCDEAISLGEGIVLQKKLTHRISFVNASALEISDLSQMDVVYLAALAGNSNFEKRQITEHLYEIMKPRSILVARSATGLRTLIYEKLTSTDFGKFRQFRHFDPTNKVIINSVAMGMKLE